MKGSNSDMIEVKNLTKRYGNNIAVNDLSFTVEPGRIYGFLGPNGAGKSTTMNIITGCLAATEGQVLINGYDIREEPIEAKRFIGYLPEQPPIYQDMTPDEYLHFVGRAKGLRGAALEEQIETVIADTCIDNVRNKLIRNLSKGYKQRVGIAQAMLGSPEVIILDEPTVGLDPRQIIYIRDLIKRLGEKHTVILSSHILSEISAVCDYVMIISHGRLVASDTLANLSASLENGGVTEMTVRGDENAIAAALDSVEGIAEYVLSESAPKSGVWNIRITAQPETDIRDSLFTAFADLRLPVYKLAPEVMTLESMFLRLTSEDNVRSDEGSDELYETDESDEADEGDDIDLSLSDGESDGAGDGTSVREAAGGGEKTDEAGADDSAPLRDVQSSDSSGKKKERRAGQSEDDYKSLFS